LFWALTLTLQFSVIIYGALCVWTERNSQSTYSVDDLINRVNREIPSTAPHLSIVRNHVESDEDAFFNYMHCIQGRKAILRIVNGDSCSWPWNVKGTVPGRATAQSVTFRRLSPRRSGFELWSDHVGFVVDKLSLEVVFSENYGFSFQLSFHRMLAYVLPSSGAGKMGPLVAGVPSGLTLTPTPRIKVNWGTAPVFDWMNWQETSVCRDGLRAENRNLPNTKCNYYTTA
jgi:hypothetical protein